jgi:undecaprenyl-diphosphatase
MNFGWKVWPWVAFFIITVALTDQFSANLIKNLVQRPRPCNDENFMINVHTLLGGCSGSFSFPSSHATNHFGMAWFIFLTMKNYFKNWSYLFFLWAATIAYGQVYIGIHYPTDVLGGAVLGSIIGIATAAVFNKKIGLPQLVHTSAVLSKQ